MLLAAWRGRNVHLIFDSVTVFPPDARGRAALAASHGGVYAAYCAAKAGVKGVILCDAGVGASVPGLGARLSRSARRSCCGNQSPLRPHRRRRGLFRARTDLVHQPVRGTRRRAARIAARNALEKFEAFDAPPSPAPPAMQETRHEVSATGGVRVFTLDSNALVLPDDAGHIMLTGSHGGLLGDAPRRR